MKPIPWKWSVLGFFFVGAAGVLLHYLYDITNGNYIAAIFSGVNESTWEHMKLMFFPLFVFALIQSRYFKGYGNFWCVKLLGIITGVFLIPVLFYTINGVFGKTPDWVNINIFFVCTAAAFVLEAIMFKRNAFSCASPRVSVAVLAVFAVLFAVFTFSPPRIPLFKDPVTDEYGIIK